MSNVGHHFQEVFRSFLVYDVIKALKTLYGSSALSEELGITPTMLSRYSRRRSRPGKKQVAKILGFLENNATSITNAAVRALIRNAGQREFYTLIATILMLQYGSRLNAVVGFSDQTFTIASTMAQVLDIPLGLVWYNSATLPTDMHCSIQDCGGGRRGVICHSISSAAYGGTVLLLVSPYVHACSVRQAESLLRKSFSEILVHHLGRQP